MQAPFLYGAPPGMPASVEHLRTSRSLPRLPPHQQSSSHAKTSSTQLLGVTASAAIPAVAPPTAAPLPPLPGHRAWLKQRLLEADTTAPGAPAAPGGMATDPLALYIMRKYSRRFMPGSHYDLELRGMQTPVRQPPGSTARLLGSIRSEGLLPQMPPRGPRGDPLRQ